MENNVRKGFFAALKEKRVTTVSAAWVFYFLTALLPVAFLLIAAFAVFGVDIADKAVGYLPEEFRTAGETVLGVAKNASKGATVFFVATVLFSGSALLNQMSKDGEFLYTESGARRRNGIVRRLWAIFALCVLFFVFLGAAFAVAFKDMIFPASDFAGESLPILSLAFSGIVAAAYVIIILLNKFIAPVKLGFSALAFGSFIALFAIVAGTIGFTIYLRFFNSYNAFYGSLAAVIVFILWAYIAMTGLYFGAFICMRTYERQKLAFSGGESVKTGVKADENGNGGNDGKRAETAKKEETEKNKHTRAKRERTAERGKIATEKSETPENPLKQARKRRKKAGLATS